MRSREETSLRLPTSFQPGSTRLLLQAPVKIDAVHVHPGKGFRGPELTYQARRVEGGAVGELALLQEHHVLPTRFYQMVGDTRASHPTTDDHGLRFVLQQSSLLSAYLVSIGCYANWAVHSLQLAVRLAFISYSFSPCLSASSGWYSGRLQ